MKMGMIAKVSSVCFMCLFTLNISAQENIVVNLSGHFKEFNVDGCFILYDTAEKLVYKYNPSYCDTPYLPASTFKIPNTLIYLETGTAPDESFLLEWDGIKRPVDSWNKNHTLKTAFQNSAVWYYKEMTNRVGLDETKRWLEDFNYGNENVSGVYPFWLYGNLRITPNQQMHFLKKLYQKTLPVSIRTDSILNQIMIFESNDEYVLRAKTGWAQTNINIGWLVGFLEINDKDYIFVLNITGSLDNKNFGAARILITKNVFRSLGLIKTD